MAHKEFEKVGKEVGLLVWRVEKGDLIPVPPECQGSFFTGDAYLLASRKPRHPLHIHSWAGKDASNDEAGHAAIFMTQLDSYLDGQAVQFTEFQDEESVEFLSIFKSGITLMKGGVASGFKHVVTIESSYKRLLHVKGRRTIRAREVDMSWSSFNKGDSFIINLGKDIFQWSGSESNHFERLKANQLARHIRDNEMGGRGEVQIIMEGEEPEEIIEELGPKPDLPSGSADACAEKKHATHAVLYMISDATGSMKTEEVAKRNPFPQEILSEMECYILDAYPLLFVWKGKGANKDERNAAMDAARKFIRDHGYPENTPIKVQPQGAELPTFKQYFLSWLEGSITSPDNQDSTAREVRPPFDASELHSNPKMAAQHGMVDNCSGKVEIFRVEWRGEQSILQPVDESKYGQFFGGDCYLLWYTYKDSCDKEKHILYIWQGQKCSQHELGASAIQAVKLDDARGGVATQVRVTQGKEPPHLVGIFKGKPVVVHQGGTSREDGQSEAASIRLFHIRQSCTKTSRAVEVNASACSLNTNDMFVLKTPDDLFIWKGKGASSEEMEVANYVAELLGGAGTEVEEEQEPESFWEALGGKKAYQTSKRLQGVVKTPRLFVCSNKIGRLVAEEVPCEFSQIDLASDDVMILDTWNQIFVWIGKEANEVENCGSYDIAEGYVKSNRSGCHGTPIVLLKQGEEPVFFTGWFHPWDPNFWENNLIEMLK
ncbi:scinderin-like [Pholidichthys leucotaenia]